ncbi:hypothetical protein OC834_002281 [Tilletia horrida]|nr:hypothetical protein OC834_002281 [Tilletia horrida]
MAHAGCSSGSGHGGAGAGAGAAASKGGSKNPCLSSNYAHLKDDELIKHPSLLRRRALMHPSTHYLSLGLCPYSTSPTYHPFELPELYTKINAAKDRKVPLAMIDVSGLDMSQRDVPVLFEILAQPPSWFLSPGTASLRNWKQANATMAASGSGPASEAWRKSAYTRLVVEEQALPPALYPDDFEYPIRRIEANASNITSDSLSALTTFVRGHATLNEVTIPTNQIAVYSSIPLATLGASMRWTNIRVLDIGRNSMAPATLCAFLRNLDAPNLRTLGIQGVVPALEHQKDRIEVARAIASFLRPRISASELNREGTKLALACPRLDRIFLNDNDLSFHGIQIVTGAIVGLPVCESLHRKQYVELEDSDPRLVAAARAAEAKPFAERYKAAPNRVLVSVALPIPEMGTATNQAANGLFASLMPPEIYAEFERSANTASETREREEREYKELHNSEEDDLLALITRKNYAQLVSDRLEENLWYRSERRLGATHLLRAARILGCEVREAEEVSAAEEAGSSKSAAVDEDDVPDHVVVTAEDDVDIEDAWHDEDASSADSHGDSSTESIAIANSSNTSSSSSSSKPFPFFRLPVEIRLHVLRMLPYVDTLSRWDFDRVLRFACDRRTIGYGSTSAIGAPDAYTLARYFPSRHTAAPRAQLMPSPSPLASAPFSFAHAFAHYSTPRDWPAEMLDFSSTPPENLHGADCRCGAEAVEEDSWRVVLRPEDAEEKRRKERLEKRRKEKAAKLQKAAVAAKEKSAASASGGLATSGSASSLLLGGKKKKTAVVGTTIRRHKYGASGGGLRGRGCKATAASATGASATAAAGASAGASTAASASAPTSAPTAGAGAGTSASAAGGGVTPGAGAGIAASTGLGTASIVFSTGLGYFPFVFTPPAPSAAGATAATGAGTGGAAPGASSVGSTTSAAASATSAGPTTAASTSTAAAGPSSSSGPAQAGRSGTATAAPGPSRTDTGSTPAPAPGQGASSGRSSTTAGAAPKKKKKKGAPGADTGEEGEHVHVNCHHAHILFSPSAAKCAFWEVTGCDTPAFSHMM